VLGAFAQALDFAGGGTLRVDLPAAQPNAAKFCVRVAFKPPATVTARQALIASDALPMSLHLEPGAAAGDYVLVATVKTAVHGAGAASTRFLIPLLVADWHVADLVYDTDTVALFVDDLIRSVHAFPDGTLAARSGDALQAGVAADGTSDPFTGTMAALQVHDDIPIAHEAQLDEFRSHPQWHLTYKQEEIKYTIALGQAKDGFFYDVPSESWVQEFDGATLMYHESAGQASEMHGAILDTYWALPNRVEIGFLVSDEIDGARAGSRKSLFSRGGLYWSPKTGAVPVIGQIWVDYEAMGEAKVIGLPRSPAQVIGGGLRQVFQSGEMYQRSGAPRAFEVHGDILSQFTATGGTAQWGFPVSNEGDIKSGAATIGRSSEFEFCTFYWSAGTGSHEVHGDILARYKKEGGPAGDLGFPTSNEGDIPDASGRFNTFTNGSILWFGSASQMFTCRAFRIRVGRVNTKESEPWYKGENDVYLHAKIDDNGTSLFAKRFPGSGDTDGNNIFEINQVLDVGPAGIVPNRPDCNIRIRMEIWDSDWPDDDDYLGTFDRTLNMANAWGLRDNAFGLFDTGAFDKINSVTWSVSPVVDIASLTDAQLWWGVRNKGTDSITPTQYAAAFSDVDSDPDWWDPADWLKKLFYEAVVETIAKKGNCFGMSLESIYSKKDRSLLGMPISRFTDWESVRNEFNVRHCYQVGAPAIWWFVGEFLSGKTHDPVAVFKQSRQAHATGCDPVLSITQNWDFSGAPHTVLPVSWNDSVTPWELGIFDPNFKSDGTNDPTQVVYVDPNANTFSYAGKYNGGEWSGGRMHYMPWHVLCERPRTPVFEAIMLLLSGVILILGDNAETASLTDENGVDLDAFGADSIQRLKTGKPLTNKFVGFKGFDHRAPCTPRRDDRPGERPPPPGRPPGGHERPPRGQGVTTSELYLRSEPKSFSRRPPTGKRNGDDWKRITLREYLCQLAPHDVRAKFEGQGKFLREHQDHLMLHLLDKRIVRDIMGPAIAGLGQPSGSLPSVSRNYVHVARGIERGPMEYGIKEGLSEILVRADTLPGDLDTIRVNDLGTHMRTLSITSSRDKVFAFHVHNRLGIGRDHLRMSIANVNLPAGKELRVNVKPGIGGVEMVADGVDLRADVELRYVRGSRSLEDRFAIKEHGGLRFVPSTYITANRLKVGRISKLFGDTEASRLLPALP
jgi:hypothetical protein